MPLGVIGLAAARAHGAAHRRRYRPEISMQRLLERGRGIGRPCKDGKAAVAFPAWAHDHTTRRGHGLIDERIMPHQ